jgi:hypothetical protein
MHTSAGRGGRLPPPRFRILTLRGTFFVTM